MPLISVIMPVYNVREFVAEAVQSVLDQSYTDFELLIIDDCSPDDSIAICERFDDSRIRIIKHTFNRGLAGARNTGVRSAKGELLAFLDSDDVWTKDKLAHHVTHLAAQPEVGVSFSRSAFIDHAGKPMGVYQMPRLQDISPAYYLCRNPIGNGSAPVIRREVFEQIRYADDLHMPNETFYFDERFRRSEDIECWIRIALQTDWVIEGLPQALTLYRLNAGGLSANLFDQLASWEQMVAKLSTYAPEFVRENERAARAFQLRYLARQAIRLRDGKMAVLLLRRALHCDWKIAVREPGRTLVTACASCLLRLLPQPLYKGMEAQVQKLIGHYQAAAIRRQVAESKF